MKQSLASSPPALLLLRRGRSVELFSDSLAARCGETAADSGRGRGIQAGNHVGKARGQDAAVQRDEHREEAFEVVLQNDQIADYVPSGNRRPESISGNRSTKSRRETKWVIDARWT